MGEDNQMKHMGTVKIVTNRLILRRFTMKDVDAMYKNWTSEDEVTKYLTWPTHTGVDVTRTVLEEWNQKYSEPDYYNWGIELKDTEDLIGNIAADRHDEEKETAFLGWCLGTRWWGQGIMPEAARAVLQYLLMEVGYNRVAAKHDSENTKSGRVMQKIGMTREGTFRAGGKNNRGIVDEVHYYMLRDEYEKKYAPSMKLTWRMEP